MRSKPSPIHTNDTDASPGGACELLASSGRKSPLDRVKSWILSPKAWLPDFTSPKASTPGAATPLSRSNRSFSLPGLPKMMRRSGPTRGSAAVEGTFGSGPIQISLSKSSASKYRAGAPFLLLTDANKTDASNTAGSSTGFSSMGSRTTLKESLTRRMIRSPARIPPLANAPMAPGAGTSSSSFAPASTGGESIGTSEPRFRAYEEACQKRGILPKFARAARDGLFGGILDLSSQGFGDQQLEALLCDQELLPLGQIFRWRLRDARLTGAGCAALVSKLPGHTEVLDLSRNEAGLRGAAALAAPLSRMLLPQLRWLDLSVNNLRNEAVVALAASLSRCPMLLRLELNHNQIQDGQALGALVAGHPRLTRLALHCNLLSGTGAASLFEGVIKNSRRGGRLADLDVAWNGIGDAGSRVAGAEAISAVLKESVTLYHLDLSYNRLNPESCRVIAQGLADNHHLYGLHFVGNAATMDADGFMTPLEEGYAAPAGVMPSPKKDRPAGHLFGDGRHGNEGRLASKPAVKDGSMGSTICSSFMASGSHHRVTMSDDEVLRERDVLEQQTTCWACEGWERVELEWVVKPEEPEPKAVWAFTSLDGFKGGLRLQKKLSTNGGPVRFSAARMVPGGFRLLAIFQVDSALRVASGMQVEKLAATVEVELKACEELPTLSPPSSQDVALCESVTTKGMVEHRLVLRMATAAVVDRSSHVKPSSTCDGLTGRRTVLLDGPGGSGPVAMPRVTESEFKMRSKPTRAMPFFSAFKRETGDLMQECFALDWSRAKVGRLVSEQERSAVQEIIQANYRRFLAMYRVLSANGVSGEAGFGISQIEAGDTMALGGLVDSTVTRISDVDRFFIASKVLAPDMKKRPNMLVNNEKVLNRHQLLELFLRVADQRFVQTGETPSIAEAMRRVLAGLEEAGQAKLSDLDNFLDAFHTDEVDDVFKMHTPMLQVLYERFSGRFTRPGQAKFMSLTEFQELLEISGAWDLDFTSRKSGVAFRMGMMTQPEEVLGTRFQEMTFLEFQHALGAAVFMKTGFVKEEMANLANAFIKTKLVKAMPPKKKLLSLKLVVSAVVSAGALAKSGG